MFIKIKINNKFERINIDGQEDKKIDVIKYYFLFK